MKLSVSKNQICRGSLLNALLTLQEYGHTFIPLWKIFWNSPLDLERSYASKLDFQFLWAQSWKFHRRGNLGRLQLSRIFSTDLTGDIQIILLWWLILSPWWLSLSCNWLILTLNDLFKVFEALLLSSIFSSFSSCFLEEEESFGDEQWCWQRSMSFETMISF